jgi:hypothetical protein
VHPGDSLLYVLSARSEMEWSQFTGAVDSLRTREVSGESAAALRSRIAQLLDALAHVEIVNRNGRSILGTCRSSLVRLPTRQVRAVLAGSRGPESYERLSRLAEDHGVVPSLKPHSGSLGSLLPQIVLFTANEESAMSEFANTASLIYSPDPPAASLAHFAGDLREAASHWKWEASPDLSWNKVQFDAEAGHFRQPPAGGDIRLLKYQDPVKTTYRYWAWDGARHCEVDPDWGRFWVLSKLSYHVLYYDKSKCTLSLSRTLPLPKLLARAVVLSSGEAPEDTQYGNQAVFRNVPLTIAVTVAGKLGQELNQFAS